MQNVNSHVPTIFRHEALDGFKCGPRMLHWIGNIEYLIMAFSCDFRVFCIALILTDSAQFHVLISLSCNGLDVVVIEHWKE
jgi:hypothetical protein